MKKILIILALILIPFVSHAQLTVKQGGTGTTTIPTGRIPFGLSSLRVGVSDSLFWDNTNSRFGIGSSTPDSRVSVVITGGAGGDMIFRNGYFNPSGLYWGAYAQGGDGGSGSAGLGVYDDNNNAFYGLYSNDSNAFNYLAGTTTVGTITPTAKLTVVDGGETAGNFSAGSYQVELADATDQRALHATDGSGNTGSLADNAAGAGVSGTGLVYGIKGENNSASGYGTFSRQTNGAGYSGYFLGGKNYFEGNTGIGTTTPSSKLTVLGDIYAVGTLGSNLVTNGDFTTDLTGWSGTNWSQSSGGALHTAGSILPLVSTTFNPTIGSTYKVQYDTVGVSAGYVQMYFGGVWGKAAVGNNTFTEYLTAATTTAFSVYPQSDFNGRIDNVSVRLITTTATSTFETPVEFRKKLIVDDRIEFPDGAPIIIGYGALPNNETGTYNVPSSNVCIGYEACKYVGTGQVTAVGYQAGRSAIYDLGSDFESSLTAIGKWAGYANTSGHGTFVGNAAGRSNTTAVSHCFGDESCAHVTTSPVSAFGSYALYENLAGFSAGFGKNSGRNGTSTIGASYFGEDAGYNNFQDLVTIMGYQAAYNNTYGEPTVFGYQSGYQNTIGQITAFGTYAGYRNTTGRLIALGRYAGADGTNGPRTDTGGILIGDDATRSVGFATQLTNYVGIGDAIRIDKSNQVKLGNNSIVETILQGKVGMGSSTPFAKLAVGSANATTQFPLFSVASSSAAVATSTAFVVNPNGSVGIGTTTYYAADKLTVNGGNILLKHDVPNYVQIDSDSANNGFGIRTNGGFSYFFKANDDTSFSAYLATIDMANSRWGIGTSTPWRTFSVHGTVALSNLTSATGGNAVCISATTFDVQNAGNTTCVTSAKRFKENIKDLVSGDAISKLMKLRVVGFDYKEGYHDANESAGSYGMIAEEVEKVDPLLVDYCTDGKVCTLHFEKFTGLFLQAIQEMYSGLQSVVARVSGLEDRLNKQQKQIDAMQKQIDKLMK